MASRRERKPAGQENRREVVRVDKMSKKIGHYRDSGMSRARLVEIYGEPAVMLVLGEKPKPEPEAKPPEKWDSGGLYLG